MSAFPLPKPLQAPVFGLLWLLIIVFFCWSRWDASDKVYFYGDGGLAVAMVELMLETGDWDANWHRLDWEQEMPEEARAYSLKTHRQDDPFFYNMSGYFVAATAFSKMAMAIFPDASVATVLRAFNVLLQLGVLGLLVSIGSSLPTSTATKRWLGLSTAGLFCLFPLSLMEAHYERTETLLCFLATLNLYLVLRFWEKPYLNSLLIGLTIGLAVTAKFSQLALLMLPGFIFLHRLFVSVPNERAEQLKHLLTFSACLLVGLMIAIYLTVPYVLTEPLGYMEQIKSLTAIQLTPNPPYFLGDVSFLEQMRHTVNYFLLTLGFIWVAVFAVGLWELLKGPWIALNIAQKLCIAGPVIFIFLYFSQFNSFFERNFSAVTGFICVISSVGLYSCISIIRARIKQTTIVLATICIFCSALVFHSLSLNINLVERFFHDHDHSARKDFQTQLKADFKGYWMYNLDEVHIHMHSLPKDPGKAPRIYVIKNYNEINSKQYLELLSKNGFISIAEYRGDFYNMPPNNLTVYHEASSYHYFVRESQWPIFINRDYFKSNF